MKTWKGRIIFSIAVGCLLFACKTEKSTPAYDAAEINAERRDLIHSLNRGLIRVVSEDLFSPPVASRIYAYTNIAAFETARHLDPKFRSLAGLLNGLAPQDHKTSGLIYWDIALLKSYCDVARHLVYRDFMVDSMYNQLYRELVQGYNHSEQVDLSVAAGAQIAQWIKTWADQDGYNESRNMPRYQPKKENSAWEPTQPTYGEALEPHWFKLRPFLLDSASQFRAVLPMSFNQAEGSPFYQSAIEVYEIVKRANQADIDVAVYWDCNPGPTMVEGHVMQVRKQNTPPGHWVGIHSIINEDNPRSLVETCAAYARLGAGMADGFITAWDTKYHYHLLRPETFINRYVDPDWKPKLESPLFPEFTSAHSLISAVAASVLDAEYGSVPFYDNTNVLFGLPPKEFPNVWEAAEEAAQSRLLGGIHYTFGCDLGFEQGKQVGRIFAELNMKTTSQE